MMDELIKFLIEKEEKETGYKSRSDATQALKRFLDAPKPEIKEGDFVERNEYGEKRYRFPKGNQAAAVIAKLPESYVSSQGDPDDLMIMVAISPDKYTTFSVDSRFYRLADSAKSNIFNFRKRT